MQKFVIITIMLFVAQVAMAQRAPRVKTVPDISNNSLFKYTISTSVKSKDLNVRWYRPEVTGISNKATNGNTTEIREYLNNTSTVPVKVKYIITMTLPDGCDHSDTLQVSVKPGSMLQKQ